MGQVMDIFEDLVANAQGDEEILANYKACLLYTSIEFGIENRLADHSPQRIELIAELLDGDRLGNREEILLLSLIHIS